MGLSPEAVRRNEQRREKRHEVTVDLEGERKGPPVVSQLLIILRSSTGSNDGRGQTANGEDCWRRLDHGRQLRVQRMDSQRYRNQLQGDFILKK